MFLLYFYQKNTALVSTEESIQNIKKITHKHLNGSVYQINLNSFTSNNLMLGA